MSNSGLIVRRSERFEISLPARVRVGMRDLDTVQLAKGVADPDRWINVDVVDFAEGGVGFVSDVFCARGLSLDLEVPSFDSEGDEALLSCSIQIQRVQMTDRRPAYLIGCSFIELDDETRSTIDSIISRFLGLVDENQLGGAQDA